MRGVRVKLLLQWILAFLLVIAVCAAIQIGIWLDDTWNTERIAK